MQHYASLSASYLRIFADKTHRLMKSGRLPKVCKAVGLENNFKKPLEKTEKDTI
tara:strand:+ start:698 stop:859 length:162 start_codon:yes stop_codon:yes gene_type:complete